MTSIQSPDCSKLEMVRLLLTICLVLLAPCGAVRNPYTLTSNKYNGLLIAISEDVPEDLNLVQKIKDGFTAMSRDLLVATKRRAYLGNVTILIPYSWTERPEWQKASTESYEIANVIVADPNPLAGNNPYVNQPGQCGEPGEYMHLTPRYLTDRRLAREWGPTGKTILHEFGHLRWGFFDEYPIPKQGYKRFYHSTAPDGSAVIEPVRCSKKAYGEIKHEVTGNDCKMDLTTSLPEDACNFFPPRNKRLSPSTGSLMFWHFMTYTANFCDNDPTDENNLHNSEAPNKHNILCGGRSQWEIMREHADFKANNNPAIDGDSDVNTTPNFKIVQRGTPRVVLVLDTSGSMQVNDKLLKANQAATEYLRSAVESGTMVGIVTFSSDAIVAHRMIEIAGESSRQSLIDALPARANFSTAIGKAILKGIELLETQGDARGGKLLLLSDGIERIKPFIADVKPTVAEKGVIVDTIRYTAYADEQLLSLAASTGGMSFFTSDKDGATGLNDALTKTVTDRQQKTSFVKIFSDSFKLSARSNYTASILIDSDIGSNSEVVVTWLTSEVPQFSASLYSPSGSAAAVRKFDTSKMLRVSIDGNADPGKWRFELINPNEKEYQLQISVTSRAKSSSTKPITLTSFLSSSKVDFKATEASKTRLIIYATLKKGFTPVVFAKVTAVIESSKKTYSQPLYDNGSGADTSKEDGVYSGYFIDMDGDGDYSVTVKVDDDSGQAKLKSGEITGAQNSINVGYLEGNETEKVKVVLLPIGQISRVTSGGFFKVQNQPTGSVDMYAPDAITDLEILETNHDSSTVSLRWTAVGDDLDKGQAMKYDLRMDSSVTELRKRFDKASTVLQKDLIEGDLSNPKAAGQTETFVVKVDKTKGGSFAFAVRAVDDKDQPGKVSNVVPVAFTTEAPQRYLGIDRPAALSTGAIVAIAVATAVVLIALVVSLAIFVGKKKSSSRVDSEKALKIHD